jgi:hypothetical protein
MTKKITCPRCEGHGGEFLQEDNRRVKHPCFFCGTEGVVSEEQFEQHRFAVVKNLIADKIVSQELKNDDPEYPWREVAAERLISENQFVEEQIDLWSSRCSRLLENLQQEMPQFVEALVELLFPQPEPDSTSVINSPTESSTNEDETMPF